MRPLLEIGVLGYVLQRESGANMRWRNYDLAWFTALALALMMHDDPIVCVINGGKQGNHHGEESEEGRRRSA